MVKLAVLVIDADDEPVYRVGREMWRLASKLFGVPVFFLRADKRVLDDGVYIDDDTILAKWFDKFEQRINHKTILGFHYCCQNVEFDYLLRANLSSFFRIDLLLKYLSGAERSKFYAGHLNALPIDGQEGGVFEYVSGSGVLLSKDLMNRLINARSIVDDGYIDDIWMGLALRDLPRVNWDRCDLIDVDELSVENICSVSQKLNRAELDDVFHFRVKNSGKAGRLALDSLVFGMLYERFYAPLIKPDGALS
jgi:hypothetical protein